MLLVDIAVGDSYGAGFEFRPQTFVQEHNKGNQFRNHALGPHKAGEYTDDTQMSIAIAELVLKHPLTPYQITQEEIAEAFVRVFKRDPRETYAKSFFDFLRSVSDAQDFLKRIKPDSRRSGAAMRALPGGLYSSPGDVIYFSHLQASVTHNTKEGRDSAAAAALMYHYFWYNLGPRRELASFLDAYVPGYGWGKPWEGFCPADGIPCVRAAVTVVTKPRIARVEDTYMPGNFVDWPCPSDLLTDSVRFCGDTDTIAALAYGAGMASREIQRDSSMENLERTLEVGPYGKSFLTQLSLELAIPRKRW